MNENDENDMHLKTTHQGNRHFQNYGYKTDLFAGKAYDKFKPFPKYTT